MGLEMLFFGEKEDEYLYGQDDGFFQFVFTFFIMRDNCKNPFIEFPVEKLYDFYINVYQYARKEYEKGLYDYHVFLFPEVALESRPFVLEKRAREYKIIIEWFLEDVVPLLMAVKRGQKVRELKAYSKWFAEAEERMRTKDVFIPSDHSFLDEVENISEEEKEKWKREFEQEDREAFEFERECERRYIDFLQKPFIERYPPLLDFGHDEWVVFYMLMTRSYSVSESYLEHHYYYQKYQMTEEEIKLPYPEFSKILYKRIEEWREKDSQN